MIPLNIPDLSGLLDHFLAEVVLCLAIPVILVVDLIVRKENREKTAGTLALFALLSAFILACMQSTGESIIVTKMLRADGLAKAFRIIALGAGCVAAWFAVRGGDLRGRGHAEFYVLLIGAVAGACLTAAANDMAMLYLAIETLSICGYLLAGFKRNDPLSAEAAMKYVIFGAVASGMMLYGFSLLYGFGGTSVLTTVPGSGIGRSLEAAALTSAGEPAFLVAVVMVFAGLAYKVAAFPFQFWCPDVYQGAPTSVAAFLAVASKGAGFAALLRVVSAATAGGAANTEMILSANETLKIVLVVMALITMTLGNVAALRQQNAKRLLAYSSIAHAGYLLLGVAVCTDAAAAAIVFYMFVYLFMTLTAFFTVSMVERETGRGDIDAFEGLGFRSPLFAGCLLVCLLALTGLPPTGGFVGKFFLFKEVFALSGSGSANGMFFFWAGVIGLLNSVISLAYYMRFVKVMYLGKRTEGPGLALAPMDTGVLVGLTVPVLLLGFAGFVITPLYEVAQRLAEGIF